MIGVFDSGFGGLTVHRALVEALPERDFVYLGDNRNASYGTRPPIDVLNLTCVGLERLFAEGKSVNVCLTPRSCSRPALILPDLSSAENLATGCALLLNSTSAR